MCASFGIADRQVGSGHACLVIAEIGLAHDGSLGTAHAYIDAAADAGADVVKFQTHIAAEESTPSEPWRVAFSAQDRCRYDYWKRTGFDEAQWRGLFEHALDRSVLFLSSPFSIQAVEILDRLGVPAWKVASGEITHLHLLEHMAATGKPILLSTGMSTWEEVDRAVRLVRGRSVPFSVFQTTTAYPCPPEQIGLNVLEEIKTRYDCPVGLSDHSGSIFPGLAAVALGASLIECHVTLSRDGFGPDTTSSITIGELRTLVEGVRFLEKALSSPVQKDEIARSLTEVREVFGRSLVAAVPLQRGAVVSREHLALKKPGSGIGADRLDQVLGRRLRRDLASDELLREDDLD